MDDGGSEGMEGITGKTGQRLPTVPPVPPDRVADKFEVLPDLVHPSGNRVNGDKSAVRPVKKHPVTGFRLFSLQWNGYDPILRKFPFHKGQIELPQTLIHDQPAE